MLVVDLHCEHGHHFEGWFASADDMHSQRERGLLSCPVCGSSDVTRRPSAPHLNVSGIRDEGRSTSHERQESDRPAGGSARPATPELPTDPQAAFQALMLKAVREVLDKTEDVGTEFADEARRIHHGDAPQRPIRGQSDAEEVEALKEEGIDVFTLPVPDNLKGPLQ